ncbi:dTDP-4-dehydrorhamnose 3,5-epimerase [Desulfacinum hydrothermale DSM 13146]|uniref:dTDP-4-dehydrorhamnose 3,5-epimerase n=1 Tax=Desulfacinum hydrothermale DSM 13146 TaxID=1121390 RepID=A0A1W1X222_9BACT|nr:dTDP-4-dehydrorhamnose 3,5-epimerase [Desulfacinum hydrothermale]SMC18019.1 dTDP-4-dehydrorhamnose 3,5-epimerase [Desulfacinum hydrothermale DSM 13146]
MKRLGTPIPDLVLLEPRVFEDERGFFFESYNKRVLADLGLCQEFVQDNHSRSRRGVLRGLHYQMPQPQGKLVRVVTGEIFDVAVDLRRSSPTFLQWYGVKLSAENKLQLYVPEGFAHGFLTLSEWAEVLYKTTDFYAPQYERCIRWDDPQLRIEWPLDPGVQPVVSPKDAAGVPVEKADLFP